ncbi:MAG: S1C family serine protease [Gemmatimonadota bacterium]
MVAVTGASPLAAQELTPREIAASAAPALVYITALAGGEEIRTGSGFLVSPDGRLLTNHHVVEGADEVRVELASGEIYDRVLFQGSDERRDLAILRIPGSDMQTLALADDRLAEVGDPVYVMGNPMGLVGTFSDGLISARRLVDGTALIQISAPISSGSSGGPVLNSAGEVIGIATLTVEDGQNLNLAVPARYAEGLLALSQEPTPFDQVAWTPRQHDSEAIAAEASEELEPWAQILADEMEVIVKAAEESGFVAIHEPEIAMIDQGQNYTVKFEYDGPHDEVAIAAVCDGDCADLDLAVYGEDGEVIATDTEPDARPILTFQVHRAGVAKVVVYMAACSAEPCAFSVHSLAR